VSALRRDVRRLPLRGPDLVLMARHPRWKAAGPSNNTLLVVECDGPIASERITRALDRFLDVCPWPAARLRRPFPWGKLHWAAGRRETLTRPPVRRATVKTRAQLERELVRELNARIEPRHEAPLRVLLLDGEPERGAASFLVLTWFHPLMDARGGENLLTHLNHLDRHDGGVPWGGAPPAFVPDRESRPLIERGRIAVGGAALAAAPGILLFKAGGAAAALYGAAAAYTIASLLNLRLPHPHVPPRRGQVSRLGAIPQLAAPAIGGAGLRAANGFLLFSIAFALRRSGEPTYWFAVLAGGAALGGFLGDVIAPRLPVSLREEAVVVACIIAAGIGAFLAFVAFSLPILTAFALVAGSSSELGRLAFQSLMQQLAPGGAHGRVFVRYEVVFQLSWVLGALIPAMLPLGFREGFLILFGMYVVVGLGYLTPDLLSRRRMESPPE